MMKRCFFLITIAIILFGCGRKAPDSMGYIVQVSSGSWHKANYSAEQIINRLDTVITCIRVEKVIIGWNLDKELYRKIGAYLHNQNIEMYFWLPVFAETQEVCNSHPAVDLWGNIPEFELAYCEGFQFNCPTHPDNIQQIIHLYENELADCPFDGVFLDRIRTQSFVAGKSGVLNCGCDSCAAQYKRYGVSLQEVRQAVEQKQDRFFAVSEYDPQHGFCFTDPLAAKYFEVKGQIISENVCRLADYFHQQHLKVGMDLFAPLLAQFVGQDYAILAHHADFIKPMLYRKTFAPAGMGYEYNLLRNTIPNATGYPQWEMDVPFLKLQLQALASIPCAKYPGLEINYYPHTAPTSPQYIQESLQTFLQYHCEGAVLSWDIMQAPKEHFQISEVR